MSGGKSGGGGQLHDYYASIAGETNCERLDFIWGVLRDDKIVWPETKEWKVKTWKANNYVSFHGPIYHTAVETNVVPPNAPWTLTPSWVAQMWPAGSIVSLNGRVYQTNINTSAAPPLSPWFVVADPKPWSSNGWGSGSIVVSGGRIYE